MLIDGAIRFAEQTKRGYETRNFEMSFDGTTKTQAILMELINALRPEQAPELCQRLTALYTYLYRLLVEASSERDVSKVDEVLTRLRFERETWRIADRFAFNFRNTRAARTSLDNRLRTHKVRERVPIPSDELQPTRR
jgi:flagellar biosynthetic protein FliS